MPSRQRLDQAPAWTADECAVLEKLSSPDRIQVYLDEDIGYNAVPENRSPRLVMRHRRANCFEGALLAAAALERLGHRPCILDMEAVRDDDHIIAVYRSHGCWGAVAKSNFSTLQSREPVYRSVRELVMSYFDLYYNTAGEKSLRTYSRPVDLRRFDAQAWRTTEEDLDPSIGSYLVAVAHTPILNAAMEQNLSPVGKRLYAAGMLGSNPDGLYDAGTFEG